MRNTDVVEPLTSQCCFLSLISRFLRARKWNVAMAKQMILEAERWRKENNVDSILQ